ncbi:MAG: imidazole glycerol phosphate synthase subunit HisH [Candidatus Thorarchaeota archaeon]
MRVGLIDYGAGNMYSILCGLERANLDTSVIANPQDLASVDAVVIPGVGNFSQASQELLRFRTSLQETAKEGRIILGICLGMQILLEQSEEGEGEGLGLIEGSVKRLPSDVKVPHMGWNTIEWTTDSPLLSGISEGSYFYFVHSYYAAPRQHSRIVATTNHGVDFPSIITKDSVFGVQFHPEKSGEFGAAVLNNFRSMLVR